MHSHKASSERVDTMEASMPAKSAMEVEVIRKATWRLLPFLMLAYFIAFVDRVNSGFAALQMNHDVGLTQAAFGLEAGISISPTCFVKCRATWFSKRSALGSGSRASW
jgi:hypothetical protein